MVKNPHAMWETWVWFLGWEDPLEEGMSSHSIIPDLRIPMDRGAWPATIHGIIVGLDWETKHSIAQGWQRRRCVRLKLAGEIGVHQVNEMKKAEQGEQKAQNKVTGRQGGEKTEAPTFRTLTTSRDTCKEKRWSSNCRLKVNDAGSYTPSSLYAIPKNLDFVIWNFEAAWCVFDTWLCFHSKNIMWQQCGEECGGVANIGIRMFQNILAWSLVTKRQRKKPWEKKEME